MKRTVISKSSKRKMTSKNVDKINKKADDFTEMVIYRGDRKSITKHERVSK